MRTRKLFLLSFLVVLVVALPAAARVQTGFLDRTVTVSGTTYRYQVYVPEDFKSKKSWPVVLFLHGSGERGSDGLLQTDVGIGHALRLFRSRGQFVVVMPQCREGKVWNEPDMEAQAFAALEASIKEFRGDRNRVYLTGISMGGFGAWELAVSHPGTFAALVPICGGVRPLEDWPELRVTVTDDARVVDPYAEVVRRIGSTPVWMFHGDVDQTVPVEQSRKLAAALKAANVDFKYTEYPGVDHNSWDRAYSEPELVPWMLSHTLKR